jgi:CheY-like chemotaxis protein
MGKILIVDDDLHIRELIKVFLSNEGFEVYEASDGVEALSKLETVKVDMAILDIMMPNMDGWQLCRELRESYDIPLLMITAKGEMGEYRLTPKVALITGGNSGIGLASARLFKDQGASIVIFGQNKTTLEQTCK